MENKIIMILGIVFLLIGMGVIMADTECSDGDCVIGVSISVESGVTSVLEIVEAIEFPVPTSIIVGGGNITVPADVGFIDGSMFTTNVSVSVQGVVGATGNISFNLTTGPGISEEANFTITSNDIIALIPSTAVEANVSFSLEEILNENHIKTINSISTLEAPINPNSSPIIEKIKSVCDSGR